MIAYTDIEADLQSASHNQLGKVKNMNSVFNRAIRVANQYTDLVGTEREAVLALVAPAEDYTYTCPTDLKENAIIAVFDVNGNTSDFVMVTDDVEFAYYVKWHPAGFENICTIKHDDGINKLMIYSSDITPYSVKYYSNKYFLALDGTTYKSRLTSSTDSIAIDDIYYEPFLTTCEILVSRYIRELATGDFEFDKMMNTGAVKHIWDNYPSNRLNIMGQY
jgi:hypothetical protein